ncbi:MAG TPA: Ig-like domain-containing protein, partial [Vicinamibacteria bacterium]|nr:Ig-like domain-containing protein [Vicinamibacteria bacterium]
MKRVTAVIVVLVCALAPARARAQAVAALQVAQAAPQGEVAALTEAAEVRVVFSEPMVVLGRVPSTVSVPFFKITPALPGSFRWSGTRTLLFTPADPAHVPYATRYEVTIDASAASAAGTTLGRPFTFSFTTPTVRLLDVTWARRGHRFDRPALLLLRFNQPVSHATVDSHLTLAFEAHDFKPPAPPGD